jgi:hypothetical protein
VSISKDREPCPWLPSVNERLGPAVTRVHGGEKGAAFYFAALCYAQSLWLEGKPAQAILQLNKSLMADLNGDEPVLVDFPPPYRALLWIIRAAKNGEMGFMGNPVRHFQHLASRMSGPRAEIRRWRAWACFHLASRELEGGGFFQDGEQLAREGLWIPGRARVWNEIGNRGWEGECSALAAAFAGKEGFFTRATLNPRIPAIGEAANSK